MAKQLQQRQALPVVVRHRILRHLIRTDTFESFLAKKFPQSKVIAVPCKSQMEALEIATCMQYLQGQL